MATSRNVSMISQAQAIFARLYPKRKPRQEILDQFVERVGLAESSASSYYQKFLSTTPRSSRSVSRLGRIPDEDSKAGICRTIYRRIGSKVPRKEVLQAFRKEAKLSLAGASTYYQKLKHAA